MDASEIIDYAAQCQVTDAGKRLLELAVSKGGSFRGKDAHGCAMAAKRLIDAGLMTISYGAGPDFPATYTITDAGRKELEK